MCIEVCRSGKVTVPQPFLNHLHRDTICEQKAGTAMPEVMETNLAKAVVAQDSFKAIGEVVGFETFTHLITRRCSQGNLYSRSDRTTYDTVLVLHVSSAEEP